MPRVATPACTTPAIFGQPTGRGALELALRGPSPVDSTSRCAGRPARPWSARCSSAPIRRGCSRVRRRGFRLLAAEEDLGRELVTLLPAERRQVALIRDTAFADIVTGNDPEVNPLELEGLAAADMSADEHQQLRALIELYVGRLTSPSAKDALMRLDRAGFEKGALRLGGRYSRAARHTTTACTVRRCSSNTTTRRTTPTTSTPCIATWTTTSVATCCAPISVHRRHRQNRMAARAAHG